MPSGQSSARGRASAHPRLALTHAFISIEDCSGRTGTHLRDQSYRPAIVRARDGNRTLAPIPDDGRTAASLMPIAVVTGSGGLIGSESVAHFVRAGLDVVGIENDMRAHFFGRSASTADTTRRLLREYAGGFRSHHVDIRDSARIDQLFAQHGSRIELVVHTAAQPSHDWAANAPQVDFGVNANGTLNLLEATRRHAPDASFIFCSTNKVYGDTPNRLPLEVQGERLELSPEHPFFGGIDTSMSIDASTHSLFGVSKVAADLLVQEYGRYFGMPTVCFRGGCLTGPNHAGAQLHGFLSYLMRCTVAGDAYTVYGYDGLQVRDNIHSADLVAAFAAFHARPQAGAIYNIGGGRESNCSMREAIATCERIAGTSLQWRLVDDNRIGDHRWWISDLTAFKHDYPSWRIRYDVEAILRQIYECNVDRWTVAA